MKLSVIHVISSFEDTGKVNGVAGMQSSQRDFSPYIVHFTSYSAMSNLRDAIKNNKPVTWYKKELFNADNQSYSVFNSIITNGKLKASIPYSDEADYSIPFICFTECTIPGIISHCERFGRFGIVYRKSEIFQKGARPCIYLDGKHYKIIKDLYQTQSSPDNDELYHLSCYYKPYRPGIHDFSHEREWRFFGDLSFDELKPAGFFAPSSFINRINGIINPDSFLLPIDVLFEMGS